MGNLNVGRNDGAMGWANANPASARTVTLQELWRTFPGRDTTVGNEHDRLYAAMGHVYDTYRFTPPTRDEIAKALHTELVGGGLWDEWAANPGSLLHRMADAVLALIGGKRGD